MFNAKVAFDAALATVPPAEFNTSNLSSKLESGDLLTACVYAAFSDAVFESSMTRREKQAVYDAINPWIYGVPPSSDRKTIPVLQTPFPYLTRAQVAAISAIVVATI